MLHLFSFFSMYQINFIREWRPLPPLWVRHQWERSLLVEFYASRLRAKAHLQAPGRIQRPGRRSLSPPSCENGWNWAVLNVQVTMSSVPTIFHCCSPISFECITSFISKYISKGAINIKFSPELVGNNPSNPRMQRNQTTDVHKLRVIIRNILKLI